MDKTIKVSDIYLRANLAANGEMEIDVDVEVVNGRNTVIFVYEDTKEIEDMIDTFRSDTFMRNYIREYLAGKRAITKALNR